MAKTPGTRRQEALQAVWHTANVLQRHRAAVLERHAITLQQYNVLRVLRESGKTGLPTLEIGERLLEQQPGISRLLDRLEAKKLVRRLRCQQDRRRVLCFVTDGGLRLLEQLEQPMAHADRSALRLLAEQEIPQLLAILERIRAGCEQSSGPVRGEAPPLE